MTYSYTYGGRKRSVGQRSIIQVLGDQFYFFYFSLFDPETRSIKSGVTSPTEASGDGGVWKKRDFDK